MDNWISDLLGLPEECQVEENLPKDFLSGNFELTSGEKNLLNYSIDEMTIVGSIGPDTGGVAAYDDATASMESVAILLIETKGGKFEKDASKVADMLQKLIPQYMILGITDGERACISLASKSKSEEDGAALEVEESFITPLLLPEEIEALSSKFSFQNSDKQNLKSLWDNYCQLVADTVE